MKLFDIFRYMASATLSLILLSACQEKPAGQTHEDFTLSVRIQSLDYADGGLWGSSASLGIFVTKPESNDILDDNVQYMTVINTGENPLTPVAEPISMPEDGARADIVGYYPYSEELTEGATIFRADLTDQQNRKPEILLTGRTKDCSSTINSATITLKPVFAKLNVRLKLEETTKASDEDVTISLGDIPLEADIDVLTGGYVSYGKTGTTELIRTDNTVHSYEAVVLAHDVKEEAMLNVKLSNGNKEVKVKGLINEFEPNRQYDLEVEVTPEGINAVLAAMSDFYVSDWHEDEEYIHENINTQK